jgi:hypothetical protein
VNHFFDTVPLALLSLAGVGRRWDYTAPGTPSVCGSDLLVFKLVESRTPVFETTSQLAALDLLLAGVLVESTFRDAQILGCFRVLEPEILGSSFEGNARRVWRLQPNLIRDSCQRLA